MAGNNSWVPPWFSWSPDRHHEVSTDPDFWLEGHGSSIDVFRPHWDSPTGTVWFWRIFPHSGCASILSLASVSQRPTPFSNFPWLASPCLEAFWVCRCHQWIDWGQSLRTHQTSWNSLFLSRRGVEALAALSLHWYYWAEAPTRSLVKFWFVQWVQYWINLHRADVN